MLTLTDDARTAIQTLTNAGGAPAEAGIRIATTAGVDGAAPALTLDVAPAPSPGDEVVDEEGARVFLDGAAAQALDGQTLDAQFDPEAGQITFMLG